MTASIHVQLLSLRTVKYCVLTLILSGIIACSFLWAATRNHILATEWSADSLQNIIRDISLKNQELMEQSRHFTLTPGGNTSALNATGEQDLWRCDTQPQTLSRVRVLCWVMCDPENLLKVTHVRDTWMRNCDKTLFMSSQEDKDFPTVGLNVKSGRNHIAFKAKAAWKYIYSHHADEFDYFVKADPDSYVIVRHLKAYLSHRDPDALEFMGHLFQLPGREQLKYFSGGPGEVMSRGALKVLVSKVWPTSEKCMPDGQGEDYKISRCLQEGGVHLVDTRDSVGRETMLVFPYKSNLKGQYPSWYYSYDQHDALKGVTCCSEYPISFHYVKTENMPELDYFFHQQHANDSLQYCLPLHKMQFYNPKSVYS